MAWEAKDFLVEQERCQDVTIEQKVYHGKHTEEYKAEEQAASRKASKGHGSTKKAKKGSKKKAKKDEL